MGTNAALEGNDYDWSAGNVTKDALVGSITAATSVLGPGEIAAVFGVGKTAAEEASAVVIAQIGEQALKQGGKEALEDGTKEIVRNALASGAKKLDEREFLKLADKVISPELQGAEREQAMQALAASLQKNVTDRMAAGIVRTFTKHGLNMGGGGIGGGAGGLAQGATEWDSRKGVGANFVHVAQAGSQGFISGAVGGGVMSFASDGLGSAFRAFKGKPEPHISGGGGHVPNGTGDLENTLSRDAGNTVADEATHAGGTVDAGRTLAGTTVVEGAAAEADVLAQKAAEEAEEAARKAAEEASKKTGNQAANNTGANGPQDEPHHHHRHRGEATDGNADVSQPKHSEGDGTGPPSETTKTNDIQREVATTSDARSKPEVSLGQIKEITAEIAEAQNRNVRTTR